MANAAQLIYWINLLPIYFLCLRASGILSQQFSFQRIHSRKRAFLFYSCFLCSKKKKFAVLICFLPKENFLSKRWKSVQITTKKWKTSRKTQEICRKLSIYFLFSIILHTFAEDTIYIRLSPNDCCYTEYSYTFPNNTK